MQYKKFNLSRPRQEVLKDGTTKTFWDNVGNVTIFTKDDGSESGVAQINLLDKTVMLNLFPFKTQQAANTNYSQPAVSDDGSQDYPESDIKVENIPF